MNKTIAVAQHEFLVTLKRWSFVILTLAFPLLAALGILGYQFIEARFREPARAEKEKMGYVDQTGRFDRFRVQGNWEFVLYDDIEAARKAFVEKEISEFFVIPADYVATGQVILYTRSAFNMVQKATDTALRDFLLSNLLTDEVSPQLVGRVKAPLLLTSFQLNQRGELADARSEAAAFLVPYAFGMLFAISIFTSSGFLLQGVTEEKENRVIEILLSSVSAWQLLTGKVLGLGAAGLAQMVIWLVCLRIVTDFVSGNLQQLVGMITLPVGMLLVSLAYFILGYLLFATLMAGAGALATTFREGQQLASVFTMCAVAPLAGMPFVIMSPDHIIVRIMTFFPLTASLTAVERMGATEVPAWELAASLFLLAVSVVFVLWLAAKIFRTGLLMYGKRPSLREIWVLLREA